MGDAPVHICDSGAILERSTGFRFPVTASGQDGTGFVVRFDGVAHGYLNRCVHVPIELDWNSGDFFESSGLYIMCSTHGALYLPDTGRCAGGPCRGGSLRKITILERDSQVYWLPDDYFRPVMA